MASYHLAIVRAAPIGHLSPACPLDESEEAAVCAYIESMPHYIVFAGRIGPPYNGVVRVVIDPLRTQDFLVHYLVLEGAA